MRSARHLGAPVGWGARQRAAWLNVWPYLAFGALPLLLWAVALVHLAGDDGIALDFHAFFYPQAREVLDGRTPGTAYPPLTTLLYLPFSLPPAGVADVVVTVVMFALLGGTLAVLGIRDWRCYGVASMWPPVYSAVQTANLSLVLALMLAVLWRHRDRPVVAGAMVAFGVALKLFVWPLALWLMASGRWRAVVTAVAVGLLASASAWAVVGFDSLATAVELLQQNVGDNETLPYTLKALGDELGVPSALSYGVTGSAGLALTVVGVRWARAGREADAFGSFVAIALLASPIVWLHYFALLLIPVALARPRLSLLWFAPAPLWFCPSVGGSPAQKVLVLVVTAAILVRSTHARPHATVVATPG